METRESLIAEGQKHDAYEWDAHFEGFPSRFDGANDRELTMALHALSMDSGQDEEYGDVDAGLWVARFGRFLLSQDSQGFVDAREMPSEDAAVQLAETITS